MNEGGYGTLYTGDEEKKISNFKSDQYFTSLSTNLDE
jgi:hypothetical protein